MAKIIFRKIGGILRPIRIGSQAAGDGNFSKARKITAKLLGEGKEESKEIGRMYLMVPKTGSNAKVESVNVVDKFQRQGIGSELFEHAMKLMGRSGKKFLRSMDLQSPAQVKIRSRAGKSRFVAHGLGKFGEDSKLLDKKQAEGVAQAIKNHSKVAGSHMTASTLIPKKYRKK